MSVSNRSACLDEELTDSYLVGLTDALSGRIVKKSVEPDSVLN